ncbi:response regulator transcription factor [Ferruginibacter sp. SUN106]|uniref:response regulator transcription factor n=1 Tax=Ferruginibacter sp. SUN106 TaxID=2978348 RepID=UPI003D36955B
MKNTIVLLVEDEPALAEIVSESLQHKGFTVVHAADAATAFKQYYAVKPHIIVLDVMLPDGDGFDMAVKIRSTDIETPILFLTSRSRPEDVVNGFEKGGNDYLKKPFSIAELIVRIQALLTSNRLLIKKETTLQQSIEIGKYSFYYPAGILSQAGINRNLTSREAEILQILVLNRNQMLDRKTLLMKLWGNDDYFSGRSLDVFISKLRKYLSADPSVVIINVRGKGYKLVSS